MFSLIVLLWFFQLARRSRAWQTPPGMNPPATTLGRFVQQFDGIARRLSLTAPAMRPPAEMSGVNSPTLAEWLREVEAPYAGAVAAAVEQWAQTGQWPPLEPVAAGFLRLRTETARDFLLQLCQSGAHPESSVFEFPSGWGRAELARYFLVAWWETHGRAAAAAEWIVQAHDASAS
jgi:hypothetical protein